MKLTITITVLDDDYHEVASSKTEHDAKHIDGAVVDKLTTIATDDITLQLAANVDQAQASAVLRAS